MIQDRWLRIPLAKIRVNRAARQRRVVRDTEGKFLNGDGLLESIKARGVLNAIIVKDDFILVAGERRLEASRELGLPDIPVRFLSDCSSDERELIELDENLRRLDLPWKDEVLAVARFHELHCKQDPAWTYDQTSDLIGGSSQVRYCVRVARDIDSPRIAQAAGVRAAYNILSRIDDRAAADAVSDIIDASVEVFGSARDSGEPTPLAKAPDAEGGGAASVASVPPPPSAPESILCADFVEWSKTYSGPTFNLLHCDFPYGIDVFAGAQGRAQSGGQTYYSDGEETYRALIEALCSAMPRLLAHSAHMIFWLSSDIELQWRTLEMFRALAPQLTFLSKPLIWHKTDNIGVLQDPQRGPRHVYETALIASVEDRRIIRATSDVYGSPTDKTHHPSTKPEPMLRYFFQMFVDEHTRLLDPTCGGGSALRAAESLGADSVLGLERDPLHAEAAKSALKSFRLLRSISR